MAEENIPENQIFEEKSPKDYFEENIPELLIRLSDEPMGINFNDGDGGQIQLTLREVLDRMDSNQISVDDKMRRLLENPDKIKNAELSSVLYLFASNLKIIAEQSGNMPSGEEMEYFDNYIKTLGYRFRNSNSVSDAILNPEGDYSVAANEYFSRQEDNVRNGVKNRALENRSKNQDTTIMPNEYAGYWGGFLNKMKEIRGSMYSNRQSYIESELAPVSDVLESIMTRLKDSSGEPTLNDRLSQAKVEESISQNPFATSVESSILIDRLDKSINYLKSRFKNEDISSFELAEIREELKFYQSAKLQIEEIKDEAEINVRSVIENCPIMREKILKQAQLNDKDIKAIEKAYAKELNIEHDGDHRDNIFSSEQLDELREREFAAVEERVKKITEKKVRDDLDKLEKLKERMLKEHEKDGKTYLSKQKVAGEKKQQTVICSDDPYFSQIRRLKDENDEPDGGIAINYLNSRKCKVVCGLNMGIKYYAKSQKALDIWFGTAKVNNSVKDPSVRVEAITVGVAELLKKKDSKISLHFSKYEEPEVREKMVQAALDVMAKDFMSRYHPNTKEITPDMKDDLRKSLMKRFSAEGFDKADVINKYIENMPERGRATVVVSEPDGLLSEDDIASSLKEINTLSKYDNEKLDIETLELRTLLLNADGNLGSYERVSDVKVKLTQIKEFLLKKDESEVLSESDENVLNLSRSLISAINELGDNEDLLSNIDDLIDENLKGMLVKGDSQAVKNEAVQDNDEDLENAFNILNTLSNSSKIKNPDTILSGFLVDSGDNKEDIVKKLDAFSENIKGILSEKNSLNDHLSQFVSDIKERLKDVDGDNVDDKFIAEVDKLSNNLLNKQLSARDILELQEELRKEKEKREALVANQNKGQGSRRSSPSPSP